MSDELQAVRETAAKIVNDHRETLTSRDLPASVTAAYVEVAAAVKAATNAADQHAADMRELDHKRDLLPPAGYHRLAGESRAQAKAAADKAHRDALAALGTLKAELVNAALPKVSTERELLARGELDAAMRGEGTALQKAVNIAQRGSREAAAVLLSTSYGETTLAAAGADVAETLGAARTVAARQAAEHGSTVQERAAGAALQSVDGLGAALGAAGTYAAHVIGDN